MRLLLPAAAAALIAATAFTAAALPGGTLPATAKPADARSSAAAVVPAADPRQPPDDPAPVTGAGAVAYAVPSVQPRGVLVWPLSPQPSIRRRFEQPRDQWSRGHRGVDLLAAVGQPVLSGGDGVVAFSGVIAGRGVVTVRHSGGLRTTYEPVDDRLRSRAPVPRGTKIGVVSRTPGHCAPLTCLHWGALFGKGYLDPLSLLGFGRPILLPLG